MPSDAVCIAATVQTRRTDLFPGFAAKDWNKLRTRPDAHPYDPYHLPGCQDVGPLYGFARAASADPDTDHKPPRRSFASLILGFAVAYGTGIALGHSLSFAGVVGGSEGHTGLGTSVFG